MHIHCQPRLKPPAWRLYISNCFNYFGALLIERLSKTAIWVVRPWKALPVEFVALFLGELMLLLSWPLQSFLPIFLLFLQRTLLLRRTHQFSFAFYSFFFYFFLVLILPHQAHQVIFELIKLSYHFVFRGVLEFLYFQRSYRFPKQFFCYCWSFVGIFWCFQVQNLNTFCQTSLLNEAEYCLHGLCIVNSLHFVAKFWRIRGCL